MRVEYNWWVDVNDIKIYLKLIIINRRNATILKKVNIIYLHIVLYSMTAESYSNIMMTIQLGTQRDLNA